MIPEVANHLISSGGKRLRPILTLATAGLCGYAGEGHIKLAAAVEFMHTATLLHDDVVDESDMRRGKAAARVLWGNEASVLVGDFLLGQAFKMMVEVGSLPSLEVLSSAAAVIAEGEVMQLSAAKDTETSGRCLSRRHPRQDGGAVRGGLRGRPHSRPPLQGRDRRLSRLRRKSRHRLSTDRRRPRLWRFGGQARQERRRRFSRGQDHPAGGAVVSARSDERARILAPHAGKGADRGRRSRIRPFDDERASRARRHDRARPALWGNGARRAGIVPRFAMEARVARRGRICDQPGALKRSADPFLLAEDVTIRGSSPSVKGG